MNVYEKIFGIDLRSLALFRIGLAFSILIDLCLRLPDLKAHYSDLGVFPREEVIGLFHNQWSFSLYFMTGSVQGSLLLFYLNAICACMLILGYKTRLATALCWLFMISLQARNPFVLHGGDVWSRFLLLWGFFLPLGARCSVDALLSSSVKRASNLVTSLATVVILLQLVIVYVFTVEQKRLGAPWGIEGSAVYLALNLDLYATEFGKYLLNYPSLLVGLTYAAFLLEAVGPLLAFSPFFNSPIRCLLIFAFSCMHIAFGLCLSIGTFALVPIVAWTLFLPGEVWEFLSRKFAGQLKWLDKRVGHLAVTLRTKCSHSSRGDFSLSRISKIALSILFGISLVALWEEVFIERDGVIPKQYSWTKDVFALRQRWSMFAPRPLRHDGWIIAAGRLRGGEAVDLINAGKALSWKKPDSVIKRHRNMRWANYYARLLSSYGESPKNYLDYFLEDHARFLCDEWNVTHKGEHRLESLGIYLMLERNEIDQAFTPTKRVLLFEESCSVEPTENEFRIRLLY